MPTGYGGIDLIDDEMASRLRALSGADRLRIASGMFAAARRMLRSHLAATHVDWDETRLRDEVARRLSGTGMRDIASVLRISGDEVDRAYVDSWAARLGLSETWQALLRRIG